MIYSILMELSKNGRPSIGALMRDGKLTQHYVIEARTEVYEYVILEYML